MSFVAGAKGEKKMPFLDEDRLYENIEEKYKFSQGEARKAYSDVLDTICEMPSADVEVVRHGRWITIGKDITERVVCSNCHSHKGSFMKPPFCNQCGALMDGKE